MLIQDSSEERVIVALDCSEACAISMIDELGPELRWVKLGMTLYYQAGNRLIDACKSRGLNVFLDLKMHDIPHQVRSAATELSRLGVDLITIHASGGAAMIKAAREGLDEGGLISGGRPKLLGVTVLTSSDEQMMHDIGVERSIDEQVSALAQLAYDNGAEGVVCSPLEAHALRLRLGEQALIVTPGVRPITNNASQADDQHRVSTPQDAIVQGASHVVVGRPITNAENPRRAFEQICNEIREVIR